MGQLEDLEKLFAGRHFDREVIILCVRWYLRFNLSLRDLVEMMAERGLAMAHTTIMRWVQHYTPEFEKRWHRHALAVGRSWRVDETYVKIKGVWHYLYRAVDRAGRTVDFRLSARRDVAAAKAFFRKALKSQRRPPQTITLDGYAASHRAVRELKAKLRHLASVEDIDYRAARGLDRTLFLKLAGCDWIREHRHCLLTGPCGVGNLGWLAPSALRHAGKTSRCCISASLACSPCWLWAGVTVVTPS